MGERLCAGGIEQGCARFQGTIYEVQFVNQAGRLTDLLAVFVTTFGGAAVFCGANAMYRAGVWAEEGKSVLPAATNADKHPAVPARSLAEQHLLVICMRNST